MAKIHLRPCLKPKLFFFTISLKNFEFLFPKLNNEDQQGQTTWNPPVYVLCVQLSSIWSHGDINAGMVASLQFILWTSPSYCTWVCFLSLLIFFSFWSRACGNTICNDCSQVSHFCGEIYCDAIFLS